MTEIQGSNAIALKAEADEVYCIQYNSMNTIADIFNNTDGAIRVSLSNDLNDTNNVGRYCYISANSGYNGFSFASIRGGNNKLYIKAEKTGYISVLIK